MLQRVLISAAAASMLVAAAPLPAMPIHDALRAALVCEGDPLAVVRTLAEDGSSGFAAGHAGFELGVEMDHVAGVVLRDPLEIAGARTSTVVATLVTVYEDFGGLVHARFSGDHAPVVEMLALAGDPEGEGFRRARPTAAEPAAICPPTIELLPLPEGGFLLGCGWCNG
jgi:hypothetical protein